MTHPFFDENATEDEIHAAIEDNDAAELEDFWRAVDNGEF